MFIHGFFSNCSASSSSSSVFYYLLASSLIFLHHISNEADAAIAPSKPHLQNITMSYNYYSRTCPQLEQLVASVTKQQYQDAPVSGPATIRLFFHDCFVEGCDASILIETKQGSIEYAEKDAIANKDLRGEGFETIAKAKALVETQCPGVVSCADILAIAARDFVQLSGGPSYQVHKGRWDGKVSSASRVLNHLPIANSSMDYLINLFQSKGLTIQDMVVLSGAHTIGFAHCQSFLDRLYDYKGSNKPDPMMDTRLLKELRMYCPHLGGSNGIVAPLDVNTPFTFDHSYFSNLEQKMGLLASDQALYTDGRTRHIVQELGKDKEKFFQAFGVAMEKMGAIGVKRGRKHGEKRTDCRMHNTS